MLFKNGTEAGPHADLLWQEELRTNLDGGWTPPHTLTQRWPIWALPLLGNRKSIGGSTDVAMALTSP